MFKKKMEIYKTFTGIIRIDFKAIFRAFLYLGLTPSRRPVFILPFVYSQYSPYISMPWPEKKIHLENRFS